MEGGDHELDVSSSSGDSDEEDDEAETDNAAAAGGDPAHARMKRDVGEPAHKKCECAESCRGLRPWANAKVQLLPPRAGNPVYGSRMQLYCRTGFHLAIFNDGKVRGSPDDFNKFAVMELSSVDISEVRIRGVETNLFLAMNKKGRLYGEENMNAEGTIFTEDLAGMYNTYTSKTRGDWFVGIGKHGKPKKGTKTTHGQKATQFLPRRVQ